MSRSPFLPALGLALLLASSPAFSAGVAPASATPAQRDLAQARFTRGRDLFAARKHDEAAAEFRASYDIVASPNALLYLARCDRERGKLALAYAELGRTATEARALASDTKYAKTADAATEEREALAARIAFVSLKIDHAGAGTTATIGGEAIARAAWGEPVAVSPGDVEIVVDGPGQKQVHEKVALSAGERRTVTVDAGEGVATSEPTAPARATAPVAPAPPPTPEEAARSREKLRTGAWIAGGVAAAGLLTFTVAGLVSSATSSDLETQCHGQCPAGSGHDDQISRAKTQQRIADVGLVVGLVGLGTGVTLFVMSLPRSDTISLVTGPSWIGARGTF